MTQPRQDRAELLAQALRENLRRRKAQARTRRDDGGDMASGDGRVAPADPPS